MKRGHEELSVPSVSHQQPANQHTSTIATQTENVSPRNKPSWRELCESDVLLCSQLKDTHHINFGQPSFAVSRLFFLRADFREEDMDDVDDGKQQWQPKDESESAEELALVQAAGGEQHWEAIHRGFERARLIQKCINDLYGDTFDSTELPFSFSAPPGCRHMWSLNDGLQRASALEIKRLRENGEEHPPELPPNLVEPRPVEEWLDQEKDNGHEEKYVKACYDAARQGGCLAGLLWAQCNDGGEHGGVWLYGHDRDHHVVFGVVCFCVY